jgi:histidine ammonia-lyase
VRNTCAVLAIEALTACRALDFLGPLRSSPLLEQIRGKVRAVSPPVTGDRALHRDIAALGKLIAEAGLQVE